MRHKANVHYKVSLLGLPLDPSSPQLYFDVLREARCPSVELRVEIVVARKENGSILLP